jgi:hypothetical protein
VVGTVNWRKSTYSNGEESMCVEVTRTDGRHIAARDSTNPDGPILEYDRPHWARFLAAIKAGRHDL